MQALSISPCNNSVVSDYLVRKIYLTDTERNLTFAGIVETFEELKGKIKVSLLDVQVYEYSSANPLYNLPRISFSRPKDKLHAEDFE